MKPEVRTDENGRTYLDGLNYESIFPNVPGELHDRIKELRAEGCGFVVLTSNGKKKVVAFGKEKKRTQAEDILAEFEALHQ